MTKTKSHQRVNSQQTFVRQLSRQLSLECNVSPCVFMYSGYPLQVEVTLIRKPGEAVGKAFAVNRDLTAATVTAADVRRLLSSVRIKPCIRCENPAFDPKTVETNRGGLCESCFVDDLDRELAETMAAEQLKLANRDKRMKAQGKGYRVTAWVHSNEGDDQQIDWYFPTAPSPSRVRSLIRQAGSSVLNDFKIIAL